MHALGSRLRQLGRARPRLQVGRPHVNWPGVAALAAAVGALLVLFGWAQGITALKTPNPEWASTKPNSAIGLLLCAASLWLLCARPTGRRRVAIGKVLAAVAVLIAVLTLFEDLYFVDLRIDQLFFAEDPNAPFTADPGRMAPSIATALGLLGMALLLLDTETRAGRWPAEILVAVVLLICLPRLVGYAYGAVPPADRPTAVMAPYTAILLAILAAGVLGARPERGAAAILTAPPEGGRAARRLVPSAILVPFVLGGLAVAAAYVRLIPRSYVAPLTVSGVMVAFVALGLSSAWSARRAETGREATMRRLQAQHAATRALIESATVAEASPRFLASIAESLGWDFAALWQVSRDGGTLECAYVWHRADLDAAEFHKASAEMHLTPGVELPGLVWLTGQPAWVPDILRSPSLRGGAAGRVGLRAGFAFPVRYGPEVRGVIEFFCRQPRDPDRELVAVAPIFGGQIGEALERKRAEELLRASEDRFRAVAESAADALVIADESATVTYANRAAAHMFGTREAELVGKPLVTLLPDVAATGAPSPCPPSRAGSGRGARRRRPRRRGGAPRRRRARRGRA